MKSLKLYSINSLKHSFIFKCVKNLKHNASYVTFRMNKILKCPSRISNFPSTDSNP